MPSESKCAAITIDEAKALSELYGIKHDLELAHSLAGSVIRDLGERSPDFIMMEGLVSAAIVRYGRCFKSGVRAKFRKEWLDSLTEEMRGMHDYFISLRDKYIAHSVNPYEDSYVTATITVKDGVKEPISHIGAGIERVVLSKSEATALSALVFKLRDIIDEKVHEEENRLLNILQNLSIEEQHSFDLKEPIKARLEDVGTPRKPYNQGKQ